MLVKNIGGGGDGNVKIDTCFLPAFAWFVIYATAFVITTHCLELMKVRNIKSLNGAVYLLG